MSNQLVWFRNDLRIHDHEPLTAATQLATQSGSQCHALYIYAEDQLRQHGAGNNKLAAIQQALDELNSSLAQIGIRLHLIEIRSWQDCAVTISTYCEQHRISGIHCHYEPGYDEFKRDQSVALTLPESVKFQRYNDLFFCHPKQKLNKQGDYYRVFTAYKKSTLAALQNQLTPPLTAPLFKQAVQPAPLNVAGRYSWQNPLELAVTESEAHIHLASFVENEKRYGEQRDIPSIDGTSKLSVALSLGSISANQIAWAVQQSGQRLSESTYFSEILWREFYKYLLYFRPELCLGKPFNTKWDQFPWQYDHNQLKRWQDGKTGIPIVDAAMRQLNSTGWMHNRLRMVSAMYLVKIMQMDWRLGESYFASQLADFDFAANNGGWQWVASTGVDAVPYFRIFNPHQQAKRFDPQGAFVRNYVPEIASLGGKDIFTPDTTDRHRFNYPAPVVDYAVARSDTLQKFKSL